MKVAIVGVGRVGSALGLVLVARHFVDELVLIGRSRETVEGEAADLRHATAFGRPTKVYAGGIAEAAGADIVVFCLGVRHNSNDRAAGGIETWRAMRELVRPLSQNCPKAVFIVASNPVDALTTLVGRASRFPPERVIGTGTLLDTMRLRVTLSDQYHVSASDIRAYVIGEHGDSQFAAFSSASIGGAPLALPADAMRHAESQARDAGHAIYRLKGYTNQGIALATAELIEAIVLDARQVMPLSVRIDDFAGVDGICQSLPVVIGRAGVTGRISLNLSPDEVAAWQRSAAVVRATVDGIESAALP